MHMVVIRKVDPTLERRLLQKVIEIIRLAQKHYHVEWIIEPCRATSNGKEDHGQQVISADGFTWTDARFQSPLATIAPWHLGNQFSGHSRSGGIGCP